MTLMILYLINFGWVKNETFIRYSCFHLVGSRAKQDPWVNPLNHAEVGLS